MKVDAKVSVAMSAEIVGISKKKTEENVAKLKKMVWLKKVNNLPIDKEKKKPLESKILQLVF